MTCKCGSSMTEYGPYRNGEYSMYAYYCGRCKWRTTRSAGPIQAKAPPIPTPKSTKQHKTRMNRRRSTLDLRLPVLVALGGPEGTWSCAVCLVPLSYDTACIDHDHTCSCDQQSKSLPPGCASCRRGLLCSACNRGLGALLDGRPGTVEILHRMAKYVVGLPNKGESLRSTQELASHYNKTQTTTPTEPTLW